MAIHWQCGLKCVQENTKGTSISQYRHEITEKNTFFRETGNRANFRNEVLGVFSSDPA